MIVVKLGGSLAAAGVLKQCLATIDSKFFGKEIVIVPGGGVFADQVRNAQKDWGFGEAAAHRMAVLAMQQMALMINDLKPQWPIVKSVMAAGAGRGARLWSPDPDELDRAGVSAGWDVTSDSLAAWLAGQLSADELILVKSAALDADSSLEHLSKTGVVDAAFFQITTAATYRISILNHRFFNA